MPARLRFAGAQVEAKTAMKLPMLRLKLSRDGDIVVVRQRARQLADLVGFAPQDGTRLATAVSELSRSAIEQGGGAVEFSMIGRNAPQFLEVVISGPKWILEQQVVPSSASTGSGLIAAERLVDRFAITSQRNGGTAVTIGKLLPERATPVDPARAKQIADRLASNAPENAVDELKRQNRELLETLEEVRRQHDRLTELNRELDDTNRGVLALYAELDEKAEHLRRADELKTRFLSNMTHEFRTPLNSILALCRFLEARTDGPLTSEQGKQVGFIRKSAESLSEIVEDLLDLAKVAAGKIVIRPDEFRVGDLFGALRGMLRPLLVSSRVDLVFEDVSELPPVYGDESKISQIVRNFISNALKFTEQGEVRVGAGVDPHSGRLTIWVRDSGIGIPPEHHQRIFEEFSQIESPLQRKFKGTGLGLPLSKRLAELMGGSVALESAPGRGSTFSVSLPLRYADQETEVGAHSMTLDPGRIPILAIEDDAADMAVLERSLRNTRYQLIGTTSIAESRRALLSLRPRAILLDIRLGEEQSWRLLTEFKRVPYLASVPVLIVSSAGDPAKAAALGAEAVMSKPIQAEALVRTLDRLVLERSKPCILIIDDDDVSRYVIRQYLQDSKVDVVEAASGLSGHDKAVLIRPDLVLLDIQMPDRDGYAVLDDFANDPRTSALPVAIITSAALSDHDRGRLKLAKALLRKDELSSATLKKLVEAAIAQGAGL
jgi:signal transduction histidine kinase/CheY-like chemotaxis protein